MAGPDFVEPKSPNQVVKTWMDYQAATGEGHMYETRDGRVFEGGPCKYRSSLTHDIVRDCDGSVLDRVERIR
jgi:hypothetical protein